MKGLVVNIGGGTVPVANQSKLVHDGAQLAADNPAMIRDALASDLSGAAPVTDGMAQLNAITVGDAHQGGLGQEASRPVLLRMPAAKPAGAFRQLGEPAAVVVLEPGIASALADAFDGVENADSYDFADGEDGLGIARRGGDGSSTLPKSSVLNSVLKSVLFTVSGSSCGVYVAHRMPDAVGIFNPHSN